jgi:hypothetical protein
VVVVLESDPVVVDVVDPVDAVVVVDPVGAVVVVALLACAVQWIFAGPVSLASAAIVMTPFQNLSSWVVDGGPSVQAMPTL